MIIKIALAITCLDLMLNLVLFLMILHKRKLENDIDEIVKNLNPKEENQGTLEKDVCEFYGISHEEYIEKCMGIGDAKILEENGMKFEKENES